MMKEDLERDIRKRPFRPFEVELADGKKFRFESSEGFFVSRSAIHTLDNEGEVLLISLGLISTVRVQDEGQAWKTV